MPRIRIIKAKPGYGTVGDILDVSPRRAERWVQMGLAELVQEIIETPKAQPKRGRPPKSRRKADR